MRFFLFTCLLGVAAGLELMKVQEPVTDQYIVLFKKNISESLRSAHINAVNGSILHTYDFPGFAGYSTRMHFNSLRSILDSPLVSLVEQDGVMRISEEPVAPQACLGQEGATWGLVRSAEEDLKITGEYKYKQGIGSGVTGYVIDTGIFIGHSDFEGRAVWGDNFVDSDNSDGNGHGTHVAGTMASKTYGLAKQGIVKAVKVLSAGGSGSTSGVIAGINYVANDAIAMWNKAVDKVKAAAKAVANMSLGGGKSTSLDNAVNAAVDNEIIFAVASGNDNNDACNYSPAAAALAISAGSSDNTDSRSYFSNWGSCVDVFAPGSSITSTWIGSSTSINTISGTSMASPHVAGIAMKLMTEHPDFDADKIKDQLLNIASSNKISDTKGSPNKLAYQGCFD